MQIQKLLARLGLAAILLSTLNSQLSTAHAQGTAFTYQGRLDIAGVPASGTNDLTFTLYDAAAAGATVGTSNTVNDLVITNGLFTVTLDFGAGAFNGAARWLQIAARPGVSTGAYTNLAPRQAITPAPYAVFAGGAAAAGVTGTLPAGALSGAYSGSVNLSNAANSFAGNGAGLTSLNASNLTSGTVADARLSTNVMLRNATNTLAGPLGIRTAASTTVALKIRSVNTFQDFGSAIAFLKPDGSSSFDVAADVHGMDFAETGVAGGRLHLSYGGNVGIGTTTPSNRLEVAGTVKAADFVGPINGTNVTGVLSTAQIPNLNANKITSGNLADARLTANVALLNRNPQNFTGANIFAGNVGLQAATPNFPLSFGDSGGEKISLYGQDTNSIHGLGIGGNRMEFYVPSTGHSFAFGVGNNANFAEKMRVAGNGNVGIGTIAPGAKLEVSDGSIGLRVIPGYLNGVANSNAVTLEMAGNKTLGIWDDLDVFGSVIVGAGGYVSSHGRLHVQSKAGEPLYLNPFVGSGPVIIGGGGTNQNLNVTGEITTQAINLTSDRNAKEQFKPVSGREVLAKVAALPITEWQYKTQGDARHIGPMAQDFHAAFGTGRDDKHITSVDADGVALAAIQGLNEIVREKDAELSRLKSENQSLAERLVAIERALGLRVESKP